MFSATVESGLVETMHEKKSFQADSVAVKMERHPGSLPHFLCSSWVADMVTVYGTVDHCQNYQIEFSRGKFHKVVSAIEDDFNFDSRAAWISVISKCTSTCFGCKCLHFRSLRCITIWKVKVIIWVNFLISFIVAVRTVVVQLIILLFYWSGAKNNLLSGILNLFHRLESMRTFIYVAGFISEKNSKINMSLLSFKGKKRSVKPPHSWRVALKWLPCKILYI